jgi:hypothetical protein
MRPGVASLPGQSQFFANLNLRRKALAHMIEPSIGSFVQPAGFPSSTLAVSIDLTPSSFVGDGQGERSNWCVFGPTPEDNDGTMNRRTQINRAVRV